MKKKVKPENFKYTAKLTNRQKLFIEFYLQTGVIAESMRKAGYKAKNLSTAGIEVLKNPNVKAEITTRRKQLEESLVAKTEEILKYLTSVMRGEQQDEMAMNIGIGEGCTKAEKIELKVQSKERLKAAELLGKAKGIFINKSELDITGNVPVVIKDDI